MTTNVELLAYIRKLNADPSNEFVSDDMDLWEELGVTTPEQLDAFIAPMPYFMCFGNMEGES